LENNLISKTDYEYVAYYNIIKMNYLDLIMIYISTSDEYKLMEIELNKYVSNDCNKHNSFSLKRSASNQSIQVTNNDQIASSIKSNLIKKPKLN